jgi:hypothetical protein
LLATEPVIFDQKILSELWTSALVGHHAGVGLPLICGERSRRKKKKKKSAAWPFEMFFSPLVKASVIKGCRAWTIGRIEGEGGLAFEHIAAGSG